MKNLVKFVAALCLTSVCAGFAYAHFTAEPNYTIQTKTCVERVHAGDTVDEILLHYYNYENEGLEFREWKYNILHLPQNKHLLNEKGGLKLLQIGDKITIVTKVKVAK